MTAFFVILRQISTAFDIQCEKCCRLLSNHSEKSWRKTPSKNDVEIYWRKTLYNTIFFDSIWQISPKTSRRCEKCCRFMSKNLVEKNCCRKLPSKNVVKKCCQNILSKKTVIDSVFRQILTKNLKNFVECRSILAKNVVEKNCCRNLWFDTIFRRLFSTKNFVEKWGQKMLSKEADIICRKIPSKNIVEKYRQKMFVNKLTTKFVKLIF